MCDEIFITTEPSTWVFTQKRKKKKRKKQNKTKKKRQKGILQYELLLHGINYGQGQFRLSLQFFLPSNCNSNDCEHGRIKI